MIKELICIECPQSCALTIELDNGQVVKVSGNKCPKGQVYAKSEIENPLRILTGTVLSQTLALKMLPVRTDKPIPKDKILEAALELKKLRVRNSLATGDIIVENFMGLGVNLIATRDLHAKNK